MAKIGLDLTWFKSNFDGGKDQVAYNLIAGFQKAGRASDFVCFCTEDISGKIKSISPDIKIVLIKFKKKKSRISKLFNIFLKNYYLSKEIKKNDVGLLVFMNKMQSLHKFNIPTLIIPHDIQAFINPNYSTKFNIILSQVFMKIEFSLRDYIVSISNYDKNSMCEHLPKIKNKIVQIYNPIDFKTINKGNNSCKYISVINVYHPHKNVDTIIDAYIGIADYTDCKLVLVGNKPDSFERYQKKIDEANMSDRIIFTGYVSYEELENIINNTRVYINASLFEGFGMTAIEMMGNEIPTIVADNSAQKEVTMGLCNYYSPATDVEALKKVLLKELNSEINEAKLHQIANKVRAQYSVEKISNDYLNLFDRILAERESI